MKVQITLPKLRQDLYVNPLAQLTQIAEELGELAEKLGMLTGATGKRKQVPDDIMEQVTEEAMDVAQAACGVVFAMEQYGVDVQRVKEKHWAKMRERGYLK